MPNGHRRSPFISLTTRNPTSLKKVHWRKEPLPRVPLGTAGAGLALTLTPALPLPFPLKHICPAQAQSLQVEAGLTDQEQAQPLLSVGTARDITTSPMLGPCQLPQGEEESARQPQPRLLGGVQGRQSPAPRWDGGRGLGGQQNSRQHLGFRTGNPHKALSTLKLTDQVGCRAEEGR